MATTAASQKNAYEQLKRNTVSVAVSTHSAARSTAIAATAAAFPAAAQTTNPGSAGASPVTPQAAEPQDDRDRLGEIIVTARRRQESAQTVPVAVSVA